MREHRLAVAARGEGRAKTVEAHLLSLAESPFHSKGACVVREAISGTAVAGPYSPAVVAEGKFVFVAGQGPLRDGEYVAGSIEEETAQTLRNMGAVLEQAGSGFEH